MNNVENANDKRIFGLDVIRASAIFFVFFSHIHYLIGSNNELLISLSGIFGYFGVELFFGLSGFLIGSILINLYLEEKFNLTTIISFLKRRWLRTLPNYYLVLFLNIMIALYFEFNLDNWFKYLLFFQNFYDYSITFFTESWSLSIEEFAYLFSPIILFTIHKFSNNKKWSFLTSILLLIITVHFFRYFNYLNSNIKDLFIWNESVKAVVVYRLDAILFGFLAAWFIKFYKNEIGKFKMLLLLIAILLFFVQFFQLSQILTIQNTSLYFNVFYFTLTSITILCLLPFFILWKRTSNIIGKSITWVSKISYSIYLLHYSVISVLLKFFILNSKLIISDAVLIASYTILTTFFSFLLYQFFEKPILNWRDKIRK
ncbi:acyltransferase family protein [Flavobacterium haoranii]|uniref:Peptidoglycan/LPS O-acetylase OafA/YrhL, contains acyltransferase and SGNH-hydrolase domains n=1 Tax=Flavobacterium haoranii TaxID=683124 RepID=A0A1M6BK81_9FLAO|nr:acyltransferase [Flavobacterium haoranii]SHI49132.1 Peptidoglycan/LPS O-acetylase OafA/YrhL, contains acyltransferase and SGNH-hydrolase domains [Flavobacterium haoranii]